MRLVIFSGTTEGRNLSAETAAMGFETVVCVATAYGEVTQGSMPGVTVKTGRMNVEEMTQVIKGAVLCVDATHPYAKEASENIRQAASSAGISLVRLLRRESPLPSCAVVVDSAAHSAAYLSKQAGNLLLTTGAKELSAFSGLEPSRLFPRVLPSAESLASCENAGIPRKNIIAMQGPFSLEMNLAMIHQFSIRWLVTKDGGAAGGFQEKAEAAEKAGINLVVIRRPKEQGRTYEEVVALCKEMMACR